MSFLAINIEFLEEWEVDSVFFGGLFIDLLWSARLLAPELVARDTKNF